MKTKTLLLASAACVALAFPAHADDAAILSRLDAMQKSLDAQQHEIAAQRDKIDSQSQEISSLKKSLAKKSTAPVAVASTATATAANPSAQTQSDALKTELSDYKNTQKLEAQDNPTVAMTNGRPMISSPDGRFTFSPRGLAQFDMGYYDQSASASRLATANGPALSSGANFRRAQVGFQGKLFGDWSYLFNFDFGSSNGNEQQGRVQSVYLQYDGLKPFALRVGAYPPPASLEDSTGAADTIFMERDAATDAARAIAGADGRDAITALYMGDKLFAALSYTGGKVADSTTYAGEQTALLGRVSDMVYSDKDWAFLIGANGTYVFNPAYTNVAGTGGTHTAALSAGLETTFDDTATKLVNTGAINAEHVTQWGIDGAAEWRSLYTQAGYYNYQIDRVGTLSDPNFDGWYLQGAWVLTGERRTYSAANGSFSAPKPRIPFSLKGGGWGAWELGMRYSDLDLNDNEGSIGSALPAGGVRGGEQKAYTFAVNWYPNSLLRFDLNLQHIEVDRIGTTAVPVVANADVGQSFNVIALRTQFAF